MRHLLRFLIGIGIGITIGVAIVALFSPVSGSQLRDNWNQHVKDARLAAQKASAQKRAELEAELAALKKR